MIKTFIKATKITISYFLKVLFYYSLNSKYLCNT